MAPLDDQGQPLVQYRISEIYDRLVDELIGICRGISADGVVNQAEAEYLVKWLERNKRYTGIYPFNILYERLGEHLKDGVLDSEESTELLDIVKRFTGEDKEAIMLANDRTSTSLPVDDPAPDIYFEGHSFAFTGVFTVGPRRKCEELVIQKGGEVHKSVKRSTNYLVIGDIGSEQWAHSTFGRKIEKSIRWKESGHPIYIVSEHHWIRYV